MQLKASAAGPMKRCSSGKFKKPGGLYDEFYSLYSSTLNGQNSEFVTENELKVLLAKAAKNLNLIGYKPTNGQLHSVKLMFKLKRKK